MALKDTTFTKTGFALIQFPSYYRPNLGDGYACGLTNAADKKTEDLYCDVAWDYTLKIWGPRTLT